MSMFDSAYATIKCPACGDERERELQFKLSIGRAYSPQMQEVRVGQRLANFPPIKLVEGDGFVTFDCCGKSFDDWGRHSALITIEFGVLTSVVYPLPEGHEWASLPRGRLRDRRDAASTQRFNRAYAEWRSNQPEPEEIVIPMLRPGASVEERIEHALKGEGIKRIAFAMSYPLRQSFDYAGIGHSLFFTGERTENYERASPGQPWKRRSDRRLF